MFKKNKNLKVFYIISSIIWMGLIFWSSSIGDFSSVPGQEDGRSDLLSSIVHVAMYAILAFILINALLSKFSSIFVHPS